MKSRIRSTPSQSAQPRCRPSPDHPGALSFRRAPDGQAGSTDTSVPNWVNPSHADQVKIDRALPHWPQVAAEIRRRIQNGTYRPGERLPGTVAIAAEFDVSQSTATRAVASLRPEGLVRVVSGRGYFVAEGAH
ncbi:MULTISPECIES: winged helix-turn-helix domain-containing protein [Streptomyces]|uniref:winged helix-turn-helix domain-containing protein n=1 Tax=Streptomyces TaxID=1883 RepID=UPI002D21B1AD|nr:MULTISPECIES: winged helix-turn-helix domain-containing protein [Streptomyces]